VSDKESRICKGLWGKETDPPASPELAMAGRYNKLFRFTVPRLPWRDLICIPGTISLNATLYVSTQWDR